MSGAGRISGAFKGAAILLTRLIPEFRLCRTRVLLLRLGGFRGIDRGATLASTPAMRGSGTITIARSTFVNVEARFDVSADITIGSSVAIAQRVMIITETHEQGSTRSRAAARVSEPVTIGDGCWIGAGATILPGVEIGPGSIVAAGAVVAADVAADTLVGGIPASPIRDLD